MHEIGHWISHRVPDERGETWRTAEFLVETNVVKEMWAQVFTYWVAEEHRDLKLVFETLTRYQAEEFLKYQEAVQYDKTTMMYVLRYWHRCFSLLDKPPAKDVIELLIPAEMLDVVRHLYSVYPQERVLKRKVFEALDFVPGHLIELLPKIRTGSLGKN